MLKRTLPNDYSHRLPGGRTDQANELKQQPGQRTSRQPGPRYPRWLFLAALVRTLELETRLAGLLKSATLVEN